VLIDKIVVVPVMVCHMCTTDPFWSNQGPPWPTPSHTLSLHCMSARYHTQYIPMSVQVLGYSILFISSCFITTIMKSILVYNWMGKYCIAAAKDMEAWQVDYVGAYLNANNQAPTYMEQPEGYKGDPKKVFLVMKALYGTMDGAINWFDTLDEEMGELGYYQSKADPSVQS